MSDLAYPQNFLQEHEIVSFRQPKRYEKHSS